MAKLVVIGDSVSQGFASGAIHQPALGYAPLVAQSLGIPPPEFRMPSFAGKGGLPCNIEWLLRELDRLYGSSITGFEWPRAILSLTDLIDQVEDYWERGPGSQPIAAQRYHNLAVWGFKVGDAFRVDGHLCRAKSSDASDNLLSIPSSAMFRTAWRVLNPSHDPNQDHHTQISRAKEIADEEGIDDLIVWLGGNNVLATVFDLEIKETGAEPPDDPDTDRNLWTQAAFATDYAELVRQVKTIGARRVITATVPHVTIPPITRGVNANQAELADGEKYFDYYTRFWLRDSQFDPDRDPKLTKADAITIDTRIDAYNQIITNAAQANGWLCVDACRILDDAAIRRNHGTPRYPFPPPYQRLGLNTHFLRTDQQGRRTDGGLFSLDGVHPSHSGYALLAREFIREMQQIDLDDAFFEAAIRRDALVSAPPYTLFDLFAFGQTLEEYFHFSKWLGVRAW